MTKHRTFIDQHCSASSTARRLIHAPLPHSILFTTVMLSLICYTLPAAEAASPLTSSSRIDRSSVYSSVFTLHHPRFTLHSNHPEKQYYYEAIEVNVPITGLYTFTSKSLITLDAYLYDDDFNPSDPSSKLLVTQDGDRSDDVDGEFRVTAALEANHKYMLVVATLDVEAEGKFSIFSFGPRTRNARDVAMKKQLDITGYRESLEVDRSSVTATISGSLSSSSPVFTRPGASGGINYYQAIRLTIYVSGTYTFTSSSSSSTDMYGLLYSDPFNPVYPSSNLIASDDDGAGNGQFRITQNLLSDRTYVLIVTTFNNRTVADYTVQSYGPNTVSFTFLTPSVVVPSTTPIPSVYSGYLSASGSIFVRPGQSTGYYYYQALRLTIYVTGTYTFTSSSSTSTDMYGILYSDPFNPLYPSSNLIASDDDGAGNRQFQIIQNLQSGRIYVLIVTTYSASTAATYSVRGAGPGSVAFIAFTPTTIRPIVSTVTTLPSSSTSGYLSSSNAIFYRPSGSSSSYYYYQAIRITIFGTGYYTFTSASSTDLYGYLYNNPFDPSYPSSNMITSDDDGAGGGQFQIRSYLQSGQTYVLVVTTYSSMTTASYSIRSSGPISVTFTTFTPSTSRPITTTSSYCGYSCTYSSATRTGTIVGATIGSIFLLSIIIGVCAQYQKQKNIRGPRTVPMQVARPTHVISPSQHYPMNNMNRHAPPGPYVIAGSAPFIHNTEEAPPSYDAAIAFHKAQEQQRNQHVF